MNQFALDQLSGVNKVYKTSIENIISRVIHPQDQELALKSVKVVSEQSDHIYIHFRRFLIGGAEYKWMFVVNAAS